MLHFLSVTEHPEVQDGNAGAAGHQHLIQGKLRHRSTALPQHLRPQHGPLVPTVLSRQEAVQCCRNMLLLRHLRQIAEMPHIDAQNRNVCAPQGTHRPKNGAVSPQRDEKVRAQQILLPVYIIKAADLCAPLCQISINKAGIFLRRFLCSVDNQCNLHTQLCPPA